jgi:hypothetical protein
VFLVLLYQGLQRMNGVGTQSLKLVFGCVRFDLITSMADWNILET